MNGIAVIDLETTGLFPSRDRIVELAVVHMDEGGFITGRWETLVNPVRDLGPQHVHRIQAADILRAPTFADIAGEVVDLLRGRLVAAHNASFDLRFLVAELTRAGGPVEIPNDAAICTMRLASKVLAGGRSLADCCAAYDISLENAHSAGADAEAAALLLAELMREVPNSLLSPVTMAARRIRWPELPRTNASWIPREEARKRQTSFLGRIVERLPHLPGTEGELEYLALLDHALLDRHLSEHEKDLLVETAFELGLDREACRRIHHQYFESIARTAWEDGLLTAAEKEDLQLVAELLEISDQEIAEALERPPPPPQQDPAAFASFRLQKGDRVALTGEMQRDREEWMEILYSHGLVPWSSVTKRTAILVAADPDSLSGKARKAREYGIPIVSEEGLETLLQKLRNDS